MDTAHHHTYLYGSKLRSKLGTVSCSCHLMIVTYKSFHDETLQCDRITWPHNKIQYLFSTYTHTTFTVSHSLYMYTHTHTYTHHNTNVCIIKLVCHCEGKDIMTHNTLSQWREGRVKFTDKERDRYGYKALPSDTNILELTIHILSSNTSWISSILVDGCSPIIPHKNSSFHVCDIISAMAQVWWRARPHALRSDSYIKLAAVSDNDGYCWLETLSCGRRAHCTI